MNITSSACILRALLGLLDRLVVIIEPEKLRLGIRLRHQDRRRAQSTSHVGRASARLQFLVNTFQRRNPRAQKIGRVARPEKTLRPLKKLVMMLVLTHPGATLESF